MRASSISGKGQGWHRQSVRHSNARKTGRAGGVYSKYQVINSNSVKLQNWRNDAITRYSRKGNDAVEVAKYIDDTLLPRVSRYTPEYSPKVKDQQLDKVDKSLLKSLEANLSVRFPPITTMPRPSAEKNWNKLSVEEQDEITDKYQKERDVYAYEMDERLNPVMKEILESEGYVFKKTNPTSFDVMNKKGKKLNLQESIKFLNEYCGYIEVENDGDYSDKEIISTANLKYKDYLKEGEC